MKNDLWKGTRFVPLLITQFLGAFNDNLFKNTLMTFIAYRLLLDAATVGIYSNIAAGIFILPYFLFSATAGALADKYSRSKIARILKITELLLMILASAVFSLKSPLILIAILFFMGLQSTFFGPIKYAFLPQLLRQDELIAGNAYVEASTYISIILGSVLGTVLPVEISCLLLVFCALAGVFSSYKIPATKGIQPKLKISPNIFKQIRDNLRLIKSYPLIFRTIIGATWFWILGAFFLTQLFPLCSKVFHTDQSVVTLFLILFSVGVGCGSVFCNKLLKGEVSVVYVPLSAIGLSVFAFFIYILSASFPVFDKNVTLSIFLSLYKGWALCFCLFGFAFMGGLYIVPLNALMQKKAPKQHLASVIAGNNIINSLGMVGISLFAGILIALGFKITDLFLFVAIISAGVAFYICKLLPVALIRSLFCSVLNLFFKVKVEGLENLRKAGSKALIIANHVSLLDGILIAAYLPRKITFAIDSDWGEKWFVKIFSGLVDFYPLNPTNPLAIRSLIEVINTGKTVMIFPEGRITVTGALMKVYEGAGVIAEKSGAKIIPIRIDGAQYSKFSYIGNLIKTQVFPKIKLFILPACEIILPPDVTAREKRQLTALKLHDIMADMIYQTTDKNTPIFNMLLRAEKIYGSQHKIAMDMSKKTLSYKEFLLKTYILGAAYKSNFTEENKVGIFLPNSLAGVISFFALHFAGKIPVMLNFSFGEEALKSSLKTVSLKYIITSRKFIEQGKLEKLENVMKNQQCNLIYLEDFARKINIFSKIYGLKNYWLRKEIKGNTSNAAVVLFTSGSEGNPKGVLLSHRNIISNILQIQLAVPFNAKDVLLSSLPMFHSFGLTIGTVLPLLNGVKTFFYPSPLHYRIIPEVVYSLQATAVLGTDTFLYGYGRMANPYDFFSVRFAIVGGEKLKKRTSDLWFKKFGIRIFEGYGTTETSPVISVNTPMFYKEDTVGRFLTGIKYKLTPVKDITDGKKLMIKSDTVMLGYMKAEKPNVLEKAEEWYDTGDIVSVDNEEFITIKGRGKRFAKIGGEMISLTAVEQALDNLYPETKQGIVAEEDENKGEKLIFITSAPTANIDEIRTYFQNKGLSPLWIPKEVIVCKKVPLLGNGKFDYITAAKICLKQ